MLVSSFVKFQSSSLLNSAAFNSVQNSNQSLSMFNSANKGFEQSNHSDFAKFDNKNNFQLKINNLLQKFTLPLQNSNKQVELCESKKSINYLA